MTLAVPVPTRFLFVFLLPLVAGWGGELTAQERAGESTNGKPGAVEVPLPATTWIAPSGRSIASQLQKMVSSLDRSKKYDKIESLVERTLSLHPNDWRVVFQGARIYAQLERSGYWINGGFRRGDMDKPPKGARRVHSHRRDHARALQLLDRAIRLASMDGSAIDKASFYWEAAQILIGDKGYVRLYELSDLTKLPTLEFHEPKILDRESVPLSSDGAPQFFVTPLSWEEARNDGERLLWLLSRARVLSDEYEAEAEFIESVYLHKAYLGVQTVTENPAYNPQARRYLDGREETNGIISAVDLLSKTESVAMVGGQVRKIELPEEYNFIARLERISRNPRYRDYGMLALEELAEIFENRRQYGRAAQYWKLLVQQTDGRSMKDSGSDNGKAAPVPSWEEARLNQIVKSWGRFEDVQPVQVGEPLNLAYWYRNGRQVAFTAHRVDVTALVADLLDYLKSDPFPIDPNRISVSKLGLNIVREGGDRYLKEKVSEWSQALEPSDKHWDHRIEVPVPMDVPGAYLVEATIDGGHRSSVLVWINDMAILRRPLEDGLFYYVADKKNGTPVGWAKFTFVGYRLSLVNQRAEPELDVHGEEVPEALRRQYHVLTKEITKWADAKGQLTLDDAVLEPDYRWFLLTTAPGDRAAVLGFSDLKPTGLAPRVDGAMVRQVVVTDKEIYMPGQPCHFKGWVRRQDDNSKVLRYSAPADVPVIAALVNARNEVIDDLALTTSAQASFDGSFTLPNDLNEGTYRVVTQCEGGEQEVSIQVAPPALPPMTLHVESEAKQLIRGETWRLKVKAEDAAGKWLAFAPLKYRVVRRPHKPTWNRDLRHEWLYGDRYDFGSPPYRWFRGWKYWGWDWTVTDGVEDTLVLEGDATTSKDGTAFISVPTEAMREEFLVEEDFEIQVRAAEHPSMEQTTASVPVSERSYRVYTKVDRPYYHVNDQVHVKSWARRYDGSTVTGKGQLILYKIKWDPTGKPLESGWKKWMNPGKDGNSESTFQVTEPGQYRITYIITDAAGDRFEGSNVFIVADDKFTGADCRFNAFEIVADKVIYHPGDRARLRFNTETIGQSVAVFVRPRDGVFGKAEVIRLGQKSTPYDVLVKADDEPGFVVEAIILNNGEFEVNTKEICVTPPEPNLVVTLDGVEPIYRPSAEATFTVTLADSQGEAVAGDVSFVLTPKSSRARFTRDSEHFLAKEFWDKRVHYEPSVEHGLKTKFQSFSNPPEFSMQPVGIFGSVQVGEAVPLQTVLPEEATEVEETGMGYASSAAIQPTVWQATVPVDGAGRAQISVQLPESDGEWVASANAVTRHAQVGQSSRELVVKRAWSVDLDSPSGVVEGDRFVVRASVSNRTDAALQTSLKLGAAAPLVIASSENVETLEVASDAIHEGRWELVAKQSAKESAVTLEVGEGDTMEQRKRPIVVRTRAERGDRWWNLLLDGETESPTEELAFTLPPDLVEEDTYLNIRAGLTIFDQVVFAFGEDVLDRCLSQPCAEEILGQAVPVLRFGSYLCSLDEDSKAAIADTPVAWMIEEGRLELFAANVSAALWSQQHSDGGWGRVFDQSDALSTASVLEGLADLEGIRYVSFLEDQLKDGIKRLRQFQSEQTKLLVVGKTKKSADTLDAYTYLTLLRHGSDSSTMRGFLFKGWKKLTPMGQTMLALALHRRGDHQDRNTIRFSLGEELVKNEATGAIQLKPKNEKYWWKWYGSAAELQARYTDFLIRVKGDAPVTDAAAKRLLMTRKRPDFWESSRDSGTALMALLDYLQLKKGLPNTPGERKLTLWQDDQQLAESTPSAGGMALSVSGHTLVKHVSSTSLTGEEATPSAPLRLGYEGPGTAIVQVQANFVSRPPLMAADEGDLKVVRRYERDGGEATVEAGELVALQEVVSVQLSVASNRSIDQAILTDYIPAGFELYGDPPGGWSIFPGGLRVSLPKLDGEQAFHYKIRAVTEGEFHALPARLQAAYLARLDASSDEMVFLVR